MSAQLDALVAAVTANTSVTESAITLLEGLSASLNDLIANGANPAQLQALADQITAETQRLADAVAANTQPAPPAP